MLLCKYNLWKVVIFMFSFIHYVLQRFCKSTALVVSYTFRICACPNVICCVIQILVHLHYIYALSYFSRFPQEPILGSAICYAKIAIDVYMFMYMCYSCLIIKNKNKNICLLIETTSDAILRYNSWENGGRTQYLTSVGVVTKLLVLPSLFSAII